MAPKRWVLPIPFHWIEPARVRIETMKFVSKKVTGYEVTLADMGYGLAQFLPVLSFCYYAPVGST